MGAAAVCALSAFLAGCATDATGPKLGAIGPTTGSEGLYTASLSYEKDGASDSMSAQAVTFGITGKAAQKITPLITNSWVQLPVASEITAGGYGVFKNVSTGVENVVYLGPALAATGTPFIAIDAGQVAGPFRLYSTNIWLMATNPAGTSVQALLLSK